MIDVFRAGYFARPRSPLSRPRSPLMSHLWNCLFRTPIYKTLKGQQFLSQDLGLDPVPAIFLFLGPRHQFPLPPRLEPPARINVANLSYSFTVQEVREFILFSHKKQTSTNNSSIQYLQTTNWIKHISIFFQFKYSNYFAINNLHYTSTNKMNLLTLQSLALALASSSSVCVYATDDMPSLRGSVEVSNQSLSFFPLFCIIPN